MADTDREERRQAFLTQLLEHLREPDFPTEEWIVRSYTDSGTLRTEIHPTEGSAHEAVMRIRDDLRVDRVVIHRRYALHVIGDQEPVARL